MCNCEVVMLIYCKGVLYTSIKDNVICQFYVNKTKEKRGGARLHKYLGGRNDGPEDWPNMEDAGDPGFLLGSPAWRTVQNGMQIH